MAKVRDETCALGGVLGSRDSGSGAWCCASSIPTYSRAPGRNLPGLWLWTPPDPLLVQSRFAQGWSKLGRRAGPDASAGSPRLSPLISWEVCKESEGACPVTVDNISLPSPSLC